jgi:hypothetical protein
VLVHVALTGQLPFQGKRLQEVIAAILHQPPPALPPESEAVFGRIVASCLAKRPQDRPRSAAELVTMLDRASGRGGAAASESPRGRRLFGRDAELEIVESALRDVTAGRPRTLIVEGETGSGRSAVLEEARLVAATHGFARVAASLSSGASLVGALLAAARAELAPHGREDRIGQALDSGAFGPAAALIRALLTPGSDAVLESRDQAAWAAEHLLRGIANASPLLFTLDDLDRAGDEDLRLLGVVVRRIADLRVLVLAANRPGGAPFPAAPSEGVRTLRLGALGPPAILRLLEDRAGGRKFDARIAELVSRRTAGNPLFAQALFRHLVETGGIESGEDGFRLVAGAELATLPDGVRDVFARRVARLDPDEREVLEAAAVDGDGFDGDTLAAVLETSKLTVLRRVQRLCNRSEYVAVEGDRFRFVHPILREVVYAQIAPEFRREMHAALATHLEGRSEPADPERVGRHWKAAGHPDRARPYLIEAATHHPNDRKRRLALIDESGLLTEEVDDATLVRLGDSLSLFSGLLVEQGRLADSERMTEILTRAADRAGDAELLALVRVTAVLTRITVTRVEPGDPEILLGVLSTSRSLRTLGKAHYGLAVIAMRGGEVVEAESRARTADEIFLRIGDRGRHSSVLNVLATIADRRGEHAAAESLWSESADESEASGRRLDAAISRINRVTAAIGDGRIDGARAILEDAVRTLEIEGEAWSAIVGASHLAVLCYSLGDLRAADATAHLAVDWATASGLARGSARGRRDGASRRRLGDRVGRSPLGRGGSVRGDGLLPGAGPPRRGAHIRGGGAARGGRSQRSHGRRVRRGHGGATPRDSRRPGPGERQRGVSHDDECDGRAPGGFAPPPDPLDEPPLRGGRSVGARTPFRRRDDPSGARTGRALPQGVRRRLRDDVARRAE